MWRKIKRKFNNLSKTQVMIGAGSLCILFITIGYAVMSQVLNINGYASIDRGDGMIFTSIETGTNNGASINVSPNIKAKTMVNTDVSFSEPGTVTFNVSAKNHGEYDAKLIAIEKFEHVNNSEPTCINVSVENHAINDLVYPQDTKNFQIKVTSTCTTLSSKEIEVYFKYDKQESQGGVMPITTIAEKTNQLLDSSTTYNYMDGRYLKGIQTDNYLWFNGFMWRVMGINSDGSVRMITEDGVTATPWGAPNTAEKYDTSYINDWLNNYFYPKLKDKNLLVNTTWCSEEATTALQARTTCTNNLSTTSKPVGLLSLDEYNLSLEGESMWSQYSYLTNGLDFYTLTPETSEHVWYIPYSAGRSVGKNVVDLTGARPVISLLPDIIITAGNGTITEPYMVEDKNNDISGSLRDNSHVGEYVTYAGRNYRVVEISTKGTKLILDGYYDSNNDGVIDTTDKFKYNENKTDKGCTLCTTINEASFINWITNNNSSDASKLVSTTWYRGTEWGSTTTGFDYKTNLSSTANPYTGKVGLIRVGEMLSGVSETILSKNHTAANSYSNVMNYWTAIMLNSSYGWYIHQTGYLNYGSVTSNQAVRPVIMISPSVTITSGEGTPNSPYQI